MSDNKISFEPRTFFSLIFGIIIIIGVSYWIGQRNKDDAWITYRSEFKAYQDSVVKPILVVTDSIKQIVLQTKAQADSVNDVALKQTKQITQLQQTVLSLRTVNRPLIDSVKSDTTLPPACDQCRRAVSRLTAEVDTLNNLVLQQERRDSSRVVTIDKLNTGLLLSNTRADSLEKVIINFPSPPKPNRFLGINLPRIPSQYIILGAVGTGILIAR